MTSRRRATRSAAAAVLLTVLAAPAQSNSDAAQAPDRTAEKPASEPETSSLAKPDATDDKPITIDQFLDRLMIAESGGRDHARNPRSTALGPYQFIASTWLHVIRGHFPDLMAEKSLVEILSLRTDRVLARKAATAYTRELAAALRDEGLADTFVHLRLAYLLGPSGCIPLLKAKPETPVTQLVSRPALRANPFLARLTVAELKDRAKRELSLARDPALNLKLPKGTAGPAEPEIRVRCNLALASCKRWLALERRKLRAKANRQARSR